MKILVVDDDRSICDAIYIGIGKEGYDVDRAYDGLDIDLSRIDDYSLIILDIMMPEKDGYEICKEIRSRSDVPVLFLSAKNQEEDIINGFRNGGDDYLSKPFSMKELTYRISAIMRRSVNKNKKGYFIVGEITICNDEESVKYKGEELQLTRSEYKVLLLLAENKDRLITREMIYERLWQGNFDARGDEAINAHIKNLRKKLKNTNVKIKNVWGRGYKVEIQ